MSGGLRSHKEKKGKQQWRCNMDVWGMSNGINIRANSNKIATKCQKKKTFLNPLKQICRYHYLKHVLKWSIELVVILKSKHTVQNIPELLFIFIECIKKLLNLPGAVYVLSGYCFKNQRNFLQNTWL